MNKRPSGKKNSRRKRQPDQAALEEQAYRDHVQRVQPTRETVESVAVAVILAFLFRSFVAEAFVIPTGSMAPTLQGQHVDVVCPECDLQYRANASNGKQLQETICPNCRFALTLRPNENANEQSFTGDRILVSKFAYQLRDPQRWDVIVFKFPGNAKQNYIKRLIGLPNELVRIERGDIFTALRLFTLDTSHEQELRLGQVPADAFGEFERVGVELSPDSLVVPIVRPPLSHKSQRIAEGWEIVDKSSGKIFEVRKRKAPDGEYVIEFFTPLEIARKPDNKSKTLFHLVYDTDHRSPTLQKAGWPDRWRPAEGASGWTNQEDQKGYELKASKAPSLLRYRHCYPTHDDWGDVLSDGKVPKSFHQGRLITDHYAYNDYTEVGHVYFENDGNWVGDLAVETEVAIESDTGKLLLDLVEGGVHFTCSIDVKSGDATLSRSDGEGFGTTTKSTQKPVGSTRIRGKGKHTVRFANVDDEVRLWVDGDAIEFDVRPTYLARPFVRPTWSKSDPGDFEPAGVGGDGLAVQFKRIQLLRDVYYIATKDQSGEFSTQLGPTELFQTPSEWANYANDFDNRKALELFVEDECLMPMGDNSPESSDARLWTSVRRSPWLDDTLGYHPFPYFHRRYLIGKAVLIYWPHGWRTGIKFLQIPNVQRMGLIR